MKFSFFHLMPYTHLDKVTPTWPVPNRDFDPARAHEHFKTYVEQMIYAEQCGFDWVGCNEHHFSPYGMMANPNIIGGALVYPTKKIRIAMTGNLVPINNPVRIAEEYAMLDCMSGGRLIAGLMRGIPHEYMAYNVPAGESWARQKEGVELIRKAWTEHEPFAWEGEHFHFPRVSIWPRPMQQPHPPILISASTPESAQYAGSIGAMMGMVLLADLPGAKEQIRLYKESARAHGFEPSKDNILIGMHTCIAETDDEARHWMQEGRDYFDKVLMSPLTNAAASVLQNTRYYQEEESRERWKNRLARRGTATLEEAIDRGTILCGSPETVVKQIRRIAGELNHGVFNFTVKVGTLPDTVVRRGMELFRDRVLPQVREL